MKVNYNDIFPIKAIEKKLLIRRNGDITAGIKLIKPEIFTLSIQQANTACEILRDILRILPNGAVFHMQDFFYIEPYSSAFDEADSYIKRNNLKYYNERPVLRHYAKLYITLTVNDEKVERFPDESSFRKNSDWLIKKPFQKLKKSLEEIEILIDTVISKVNNIHGWYGERMDDNELGNSIYDYCNLTYDTPTKEYKDKNLQSIAYDIKSTVYGKKFLKVLSLNQEGEKLYALTKAKTAPAGSYDTGVQFNSDIKLKSSVVFPIGLGLPINHVLNTIIQKFDNETFLNFLNRKKYDLNIGITLRNQESINVQAVIENFKEQMIVLGLEGCITKVNVILYDENYDKLMRNVGLTESAFLNMLGAKCNIEIAADVPALFFASMPGNGIENYRYFANTTEQAVNYIHKESNYINDLSGHVFVDRFGAPVVINMWNSKLTVNRNKIILGPSGTGKSFLINGLVTQSYAQGNDIIILDIGGSYKRTCEFLKGRYFDSSEIKKFSFNPFLCEKDENERYMFRNIEDEEEGEDEFVNQVVEIVSNIWKGNKSLTDEQNAILKDMVLKFYEYINSNGKFPCATEFFEFSKFYEEEIIKTVQKKYFDFESLRLILNPYAHGEYKFLLNAEKNFDIINDKFIVFDLEGIKNNVTLTNIVALLIIQLVLNKIKKRKGIKKSFIIDESTDFLKHEKMGDFAAYIYRTIRKKEGEIFLALQNVKSFEEFAKNIRDAVLINSDTRIMLSHRNFKSSYKDLVSLGLINEDEVAILDSVEEKEFFLKMGNKASVYKHDVSKSVEYIFTSKQEEILKIEKLKDSFGSLQTAIEHFTIQYEKERYKTENA